MLRGCVGRVFATQCPGLCGGGRGEPRPGAGASQGEIGPDFPFLIAFPAKAGIYRAAALSAEIWVPASAGTTITLNLRTGPRGKRSRLGPAGFRLHIRI